MSRWNRSVVSCSLAVAIGFASSSSGNADDWPQWRGPNSDGVSTEKGWLTKWPSEGPKVLWKVSLGTAANNRDGSSTVAVVGKRVYVMGTGFAYCLDVASGKPVWKIPFSASHSTPTVDGERVYFYGTQGRLECVNANTGKPIWKKEMRRAHGTSRAGAYGYASSPLIVDDLVLISARVDGGALFAFDKKTGELKWKAMHAGHRGYAYWSSPVPATIEGKRQIVWLAGPSVVGLNPADGKTLWKHEIPPENKKVGCAASTPVVYRNYVVAQYHPPHARGYTFCLQIKDGKAKEVWKNRTLATWYFSCIGKDGVFYGIDQSPRNRNRAERDIGRFHCHDVATGKLLWSINGFGQSGKRPVRYTRRLNPAGTFMIADNKMISWGKELVIAEVSPKGHKVLAKAKLPHTGYRTMPVLANGRLYLRTRDGRLMCLDLRRSTGSRP